MKNEEDIVVSVIILTYNQERYIAQAIEGVLMQRTDYPMEIIVSDDCSNDSTPEICRHYAELHPDKIRFIANKKNKGLVDNYFDTLLLVKGRYVADCAGDDYWSDPDKLDRQIAILEKDESIVLTHTDFKIYDEADQTLQKEGTYKTRGVVKPVRAHYSTHIYTLLNQHIVPFVFLSSACFRTKTFREVYDKYEVYFRNKAYPCEDYQLIFFLLFSGDFYYEDRATVVYRVSESISNSKAIDRQFDFIYRTYLLRVDLIQNFKFEASRCELFFYTRLKSILSLSMCLGKNEYGRRAVEEAHRAGYVLPMRLKLYAWMNNYKWTAMLFAALKQLKK